MKKTLAKILVTLLICTLLVPMGNPLLALETDSSNPPFVITYPDDVEGYGNSSALERIMMTPENQTMVQNNLPGLSGKFSDPLDAKRYAELLAYKSLVSTYLTTAKLNFNANIFDKVPQSNINVTISYPPGTDPDKDPGNYSDRTNIYFSTGTPSQAELMHDAGHELAHVYQLQYFNDYNNYIAKGMLYSRRWFMEASADYAAYIGLNKKDSKAGENIRMDFIRTPLTYSPSNKDRHQYHAAWLLDYLVKSGTVNFKQLFNTVTSSWMTGTEGVSSFADTLTPINSALGINGKTTLNIMYYKFAENLIFGNDSPIWQFTNAKTRAAAAFSEKDPMSAGAAEVVNINWDSKKEFTRTLETQGEGTGVLLGVNSSFDTKKSASKQIRIEILGNLSDNTMLGVNTLYGSGDVRSSGNIENGKKQVIVSVKPGEKLYLLFTNVSSGAKSVRVKLSVAEGEYDVSPAAQQGTKDTLSSLTAIVKKAPAGIKRFAYVVDFGDKSKNYEGSINTPAGSGSGKFTHKYGVPGSYTGTVSFFGLNGKDRTQLESKTFTVEIKDKLSVQLQPAQSSIAKGASINFAAVLNMGVPNASYVWDFGDGVKATGGTNISHIYNKEGNFTVTLTVLDGKSKKLLASAKAAATVIKKAEPKFGWVRTTVVQYNGIAPNDSNYSASGGSGSTTLNYKIWNSNSQAEEAFSVNYTWTEPPAVIYPDQKIQLTMTGAVTNNTMDYYNLNTSMGVFFDNIDIDPGFYAGGPVLVDESGNGSINLGKASPFGTPTTLKVSAAPGKGFYPPDKMALIVALYNGRCVGTKYIYEWKQIDTANQ